MNIYSVAPYITFNIYSNIENKFGSLKNIIKLTDPTSHYPKGFKKVKIMIG